MSFKEMKVSSKIIIGFSSIIAFAVVVGAVGITQMKKIDAMDTMLYEKGVIPLNHVADASEAFMRIRINLRDLIRANDAAELKKFEDNIAKLTKDFQENVKAIESTLMTENGKKIFHNVETTFANFQTHANKIMKLAGENKDKEAYAVLDKEAFQANKEVQEAFNALQENKLKAAQDISDGNTATANSATTFMLLLLGVGATFAAGLAFFISRDISTSLSAISANLNEASSQVASAAEQLASASTQLSSSSSEQASAIEETSASLEELSGMVQNNVTTAETSVELADQVKNISETGNSTMNKLETAMKEILVSNEKIEQLVKVIGNIGDKTEVMGEIVFQTKLLSFNASVEAERAGEHGRGFAVVAQEVGNLAEMSGKAAKEISEIVKESISNAETITHENKKKVEQGNAYVVETAKYLKEIMNSAITVSDGAKQVLSASKDQSKGIQQISVAMNQVDKATQENAATAEEAASSSEELSAQTEVLNSSVNELVKIVYGAKGAKTAVKNTSRLVAKPKAQVASVSKKKVSAPVTTSRGPDEGWANL